MITNFEISAISDVLRARLIERAGQPQMASMKDARWRTGANDVPDMISALPLMTRRWRDHDGECRVLFEEARWSAMVNLHPIEGTVWVQVVAEAEVLADAVIDELRDLLPRRAHVEESTQVPVAFWSLGAHGPSSRERRLDVIRWSDACDNYPAATGARLGDLLGAEFAPGVGGQLIIWHGPPGTGKTSALRSLAWEWRRWCDLHYITDPEAFFGQHASYMLDVLLSGSAGPRDVHEAEEIAERSDDPRAVDGRWRLLVLEDTGEMLSADAKERAGQGLSRLLNVVDGMIGQGLRVLVLVTTNEPLRTLHPAIRRPGRCGALIEFPTFATDDANTWLREHGDERAAVYGGKAYALADLYAMVAGRDVDRAPSATGFGAG